METGNLTHRSRPGRMIIVVQMHKFPDWHVESAPW
jgi:hypothetical protein